MASQDAVCVVCGQEEGPFHDVRSALRVLKGWRKVSPVEAWVEGVWLAGYKRSWYCMHCLVHWDRARITRQKTDPVP